MSTGTIVVSALLPLFLNRLRRKSTFERGALFCSTKFSPPSSTTTAAPPPKPTSTGTTIKRGISYNQAQLTENFSGSKVSWAYNWASAPGGELPKDLEFVPMLWGGGDNSNWVNDATAAIASGSTHLLGMNEPDLGAQSNLSPAAAAALWKQFMEPFAGKAKLCSPAITNGAAPMGEAWLDDFLSACDGCTIDCIAFHIYDSATNVAYFKNYITDMGTKYGKPTWMTEFGASGSTQDQQTFLNEMLPFLDNLTTVERYAYFMAGQDILVDNSGNLLPLGQTYNTAS
ncbi:hypothetical protein PHLCEN_2v8479 [Hermanssonia centrifuga]|uniref:Asl1-like glycosyl hydrolase catalytic domain-containing protein n=2 Tax=Hermanssonia centrifuga TaxID=98765 RepID=A0A2R6NTI3_9APHY|nr:hypothetical protein PHLCEN_2v8479 [Hermanssonia centrifuga]